MPRLFEHLPDPDACHEPDIDETSALDVFALGTLERSFLAVLDGIGGEKLPEKPKDPLKLPVINPYLPTDHSKPEVFLMERFRLEPVYEVPVLDNRDEALADLRVQFEQIMEQFSSWSETCPRAGTLVISLYNETLLLITSIIDVVSWVPSRAPNLAKALAQLRRGEDFEPVNLAEWVKVFLGESLLSIVEQIGRLNSGAIGESDVLRDFERKKIPNLVILFFTKLFQDKFPKMKRELRKLVKLWFKGIEFKMGYELEVQGGRTVENFEMRANEICSGILQSLRGIDFVTAVEFPNGEFRKSESESVASLILAYRKKRSEFFYDYEYPQADETQSKDDSTPGVKLMDLGISVERSVAIHVPKVSCLREPEGGYPYEIMKPERSDSNRKLLDAKLRRIVENKGFQDHLKILSSSYPFFLGQLTTCLTRSIVLLSSRSGDGALGERISLIQNKYLRVSWDIMDLPLANVLQDVFAYYVDLYSSMLSGLGGGTQRPNEQDLLKAWMEWLVSDCLPEAMVGALQDILFAKDPYCWLEGDEEAIREKLRASADIGLMCSNLKKSQAYAELRNHNSSNLVAMMRSAIDDVMDQVCSALSGAEIRQDVASAGLDADIVGDLSIARAPSDMAPYLI